MLPLQNIPLSTSESHPINVDFIPADKLGDRGRLGMTIAPGKQNVGMQFVWQRDLQQDLDRLRNHYHTDTLVSLIEEPELSQLQIPTLFTDVQNHGMGSVWFPIPDFRTPKSTAALRPLVQDILDRVAQQQTVVVHCKAGLGRSGLVVASCLTTLGYSPDEAFHIVREARPGSVETQAQEAFVEAFATAWHQGSFQPD